MLEQGMLSGATIGQRADRRVSSLLRVALDNQWIPVPSVAVKKLITSVTFYIMLAQVGVFIASLVISGGFAPPSQNATFGPTRCALIAIGAKFSPFIVHKDEYWRLVTALFVHSGLVTIIITLLMELVIILPVELEHGRLLTLFVFFLCGIAGYTFSCLASPIAADTGALPSILGFVGLRLTYMFLDWPAILRDRRKLGAIEAITAFIALIVGQSTFVDNYSSFAGCIVGFFLGGIFLAGKVEDNDACFQKSVMALAGVTTLFVLFVCAISLGLGQSVPLIDQYMYGNVCMKMNPLMLYPFNSGDAGSGGTVGATP
jgi:membrane associated rhomboid family serine protease